MSARDGQRLVQCTTSHAEACCSQQHTCACHERLCRPGRREWCSLEPHVAVVWSGICNLTGVLFSSGAVAFAVVSLLPVELILHVGSNAGFAMVFALLISAILWNLGTWWLGLPASSSHTLIGSIIGVGVANALMHGRDGTSGVDWAQATKVGYSLLLSPLIGFVASALCNLHLEIRYGENAHHMLEALFKAFARATSAAVRLDPRVVGVPSTKGTLTT